MEVFFYIRITSINILYSPKVSFNIFSLFVSTRPVFESTGDQTDQLYKNPSRCYWKDCMKIIFVWPPSVKEHLNEKVTNLGRMGTQEEVTDDQMDGGM